MIVISLRLVRLIEHHSDELAAELVIKLETFIVPPTYAKSRSMNYGGDSRKSCGT